MENSNHTASKVSLFEADEKYLELLEFCFHEGSNGKVKQNKNHSFTTAIEKGATIKTTKVVESKNDSVPGFPNRVKPIINSTQIGDSYFSKIRSLGDQMFNFYLQKRYKAFVWTALESGAGTSTIVYHLASLLTDSGLKVLIVDANSKSQTKPLFFNQEDEVSLTQFLNPHCRGLQIVKRTTKNNLFLIDLEKQSMNLVGLVKNKILKSLIEELKNKFDFILMDAPSLDNYVEAVICAHIGDGCVLVANAETTRIDKAQAIIKQLQSGGVNVLGLVLNRKKSYLPKFLNKWA